MRTSKPHDVDTVDLVDDSMSSIRWKGLAFCEVDLPSHQSGGGASQMESRSINGQIYTNDTRIVTTKHNKPTATAKLETKTMRCATTLRIPGTPSRPPHPETPREHHHDQPQRTKKSPANAPNTQKRTETARVLHPHKRRTSTAAEPLCRALPPPRIMIYECWHRHGGHAFPATWWAR